VLLADDVIEPEHVPLGPASGTTSAPARTGAGLHGELGQIERERILQVLDDCGGNQSKAAIALGISRGTLATRLKAYGVIKSKR
jgi:DNA-binding NtrC family response regulator